MSERIDRFFTGEPQPEPSELDVPTVHELRFRIAGLIVTEQISVAHSKGLEIEQPKTDEELIEAAGRMEEFLQQEFPVIKRERAAYRRALWDVMNLVDTMEEEALRQQDD